ncbi:hypothetical protein GLOIN_2v1535904 [Rhizophagus irregularis DAOM 181602=DAOM 197198]|uniref:Uncharacterized protein n=1 Tax=Rhizophagus irregularis (strain DAOM 181602 / DAOM 197198 / MUCL 43194) TaxID=747089 RepID=A0A2P4QLT4_RHIID|nr:hypothetical protein GLOIN_2v1535904 [Rhizophagus irregularis DAOM 181602=DAOM 197198]POG78607.1 hypothetical protein GLOIN_2v1535904 [Rhizophagus irregularis DAOM 181602=DAOM 197198]|eukprot:XP_025185473.1 hypothetical protein GLOIN_2v1535904 [Rhizophagus irregularis DAOM 181602=DAOM 197198]
MTSIYVKDQTVVKYLISSFRNSDNGIRASLKEESIYRQMFALKPENINSFQLKLILHIILPQNYDINLFIYGLDEEAAKKKMEEIYENVCKAIPWEVTCIRSKHCVTIISQYLAYSKDLRHMK